MNYITRSIGVIMGYISGSGIGCAERTAGLASSPRRVGAVLMAMPLLGMSMPTPPAQASLTVTLDGLRNDKGVVHLCLTRDTADFLDCKEHAGRITHEMRTANAGPVELGGLAPGKWSLLVLHDENDNGKLDTMLGIPREGFGFSGNPKIRMGPPKAKKVRFDLPAGESAQRVKVRYLL